MLQLHVEVLCFFVLLYTHILRKMKMQSAMLPPNTTSGYACTSGDSDVILSANV